MTLWTYERGWHILSTLTMFSTRQEKRRTGNCIHKIYVTGSLDLWQLLTPKVGIAVLTTLSGHCHYTTICRIFKVHGNCRRSRISISHTIESETYWMHILVDVETVGSQMLKFTLFNPETAQHDISCSQMFQPAWQGIGVVLLVMFVFRSSPMWGLI